MLVEKFDKEYVYNVCYNYGKEGKCMDYIFYLCMYIIMLNFGVGDYYGCFFCYFSVENLYVVFLGMCLELKMIDEVMEKIRGWYYQLVCVVIFEGFYNC